MYSNAKRYTDDIYYSPNFYDKSAKYLNKIISKNTLGMSHLFGGRFKWK